MRQRSEMDGFFQASYFFGYMSVISYAFFIMLGAIGFYRSVPRAGLHWRGGVAAIDEHPRIWCCIQRSAEPQERRRTVEIREDPEADHHSHGKSRKSVIGDARPSVVMVAAPWPSCATSTGSSSATELARRREQVSGGIYRRRGRYIG
jgi:hypothetical protein